VVGRQKLVPVAQVVLAELAGRVAKGLEELGNRRVLSFWMPTGTPGMPTFVSPVRNGLCPRMKAARPAVQDCWP
jgi:hypothetical protein